MGVVSSAQVGRVIHGCSMDGSSLEQKREVGMENRTTNARRVSRCREAYKSPLLIASIFPVNESKVVSQVKDGGGG